MKTPSIEIETDELCSYGCNNKASFLVTKSKKLCCSASISNCDNIKRKNSESCKKHFINNPYKRDYSKYSDEVKNKMNWKKGLTKETDERIRKMSEKLSKGYAEGLYSKSTGKGKTFEAEQERRRKLSVARNKVLENNKNISWFKLSNGISVQGSWEHTVGELLLKQGYTVSRKRVNYDGHRTYTPDFCINDGEFFIEVKGWLSDRDKEKYKKVFKDNNIKVFLIRDELGIGNYTKFINEKISIFECEDLKESIYK